MSHANPLRQPDAGRIARLFFCTIWNGLKKIKTALLLIGLLLSLGLNVTTLTMEPVFAALSSTIETVAKTLPISWTVNPKTGMPKALTIRQKHKSKVSALRSRLSSMKASVARQSKKSARLVAPITRRLRTRIAKGAGRSLASATGEAIPFAGIAIVVGATTWEIYDACQSAKDLAKLDRALGIVNDSEQAETICGLTPPTKEELLKKIKSSPAQVWEAATNALQKDETDSPPEDDMLDLPSWEELKRQSKNRYHGSLEWLRKTLGR